MNIRSAILICSLLVASFLTGCAQLNAKENDRTYKDGTMTIVPAKQFDETDAGKRIIVGSVEIAQESGCRLMQRYKVSTNQNFKDSLNLLKYRAALLGAERIAIINHEELDAKEEKYARAGFINEIAVKEGTVLNGADYHSTIIADLFDCSCPTCGCTPDEKEKAKETGGFCTPKK